MNDEYQEWETKQDREHVRRLQASDSAKEVAAEANWRIPVQEMRAEWHAQNKSTDDKEELNATVSVRDDMPVRIGCNLSGGSQRNLNWYVKENNCENGNKAQTIDLRDVGIRGCDASKLKERE